MLHSCLGTYQESMPSFAALQREKFSFAFPFMVPAFCACSVFTKSGLHFDGFANGIVDSRPDVIGPIFTSLSSMSPPGVFLLGWSMGIGVRLRRELAIVSLRPGQTCSGRRKRKSCPEAELDHEDRLRFLWDLWSYTSSV